MNDRLSATFQALADPTRRQILLRLTRGEATVQELAAPLPISQPAVSKHLKVLEHAGLIERRQDAQRRWCRARPEALNEILVWTTEFQRRWDDRFARLDDLLAEEDAHDRAPSTRRSPRSKKESKI